ncbi:MAG TPA: glycosyltransferase family 39 protein [Gaiellaceae bacterium]|nr:glycosyltransferase family 39 protein [Gaiellaceae bacterium]
MAGCTTAVAAFLLARLRAWPPHEDETLALFVGRGSLPHVLATVHGERGGAPLHFLLAWLVNEVGGGLTALRLFSALFAVGSIPVIALLARRLAGPAAALAACVVVGASWMLLFHGVYARMYSLFLFTSALSYLALVVAADRGGTRRWMLWGLAAVAMVAAHPYGALVIASQGLWVLATRTRLREAVPAFAAVGVVCIPFWYTDLVLARRFDVGVGGGAGGQKLRGPLDVLGYLSRASGDFVVGWPLAIAAVLLLAAAGFATLWRRDRPAALLALSVFATPALAFLTAKMGSSAAPESRHLIFTFPFFAMLVGVGVLRLRRITLVLVPFALAALVAGELAWGYGRTPLLYKGEPRSRKTARAEASAWLARTSRPNDVMFGYDPLFLGAWERNRTVSHTVVPRADPVLALHALRDAPQPLGRGVWVLDASDTNNYDPKPTIPLRVPLPHSVFEARVFGPFLVIRTRRPVVTPGRFLQDSSSVMLTGKSLFLGDADINFVTVRRAADQLSRDGDGISRSVSSR